jgi:MFS family permease
MAEETVPGYAVAPPPQVRNPDEDGRLDSASRGRLIGILVMLALYSEVVPFQYAMSAVLTPLVGKSFPAAGDNVTWMITIIGVVGGGTMALVAKMADIWGKKRMLLSCSAVFFAGSVLCATTTSWPLFLTGRGLQAMALGMSALCYSLVRDIMPRSWIPISIGFIGTGLGVSAVAGPMIAGALTDHYSWRSIFWFLAIYKVVVIPAFVAIVPDSPLRIRQRLDVVGGILIGVGVAGILVYVSQGQSWGWSTPSCYAYLIGGLAILAAFVAWENRTTDPMMDLALLRQPRVAMILAISFFVTAVLVVQGFLAAYMFLTGKDVVEQAVIAGASQKTHVPVSIVQQFVHFRGDLSYAKGFTVWQLSVHILIFMSISAMIVGPLGGMWARRSGPRRPLLAGVLALLASTALLSAWHNTWPEQAAMAVLFGIGYGFFFGSMPNMIIDNVPREQQAVSAGMMAVLGAIGTAFASAVLTAVLVRHPFQLVATPPGGKPIVSNIPQVYTNSGYGQAYLVVGVGSCVIALVLVLLLKAGRTASRGGAAA